MTNPTPAPKAIEALPERRSPTDFALEHAEYMAKHAERLLEALNEHAAALMALELGVEDDHESLKERIEHAAQDLGEGMSQTRSGIYEFRKRRDRALAAAQAEQAKPIVLTGAQLVEAADFIVPDRADPDQLEDEARLQFGAGHSGEGWYISFDELPEEGSMLLDGSTVLPSPPSDRGPAGTPPPVEQEPAAWRYQDAKGHYRYRSYTLGFDREYAILKPVPLFLAPLQADRADAEDAARYRWLRDVSVPPHNFYISVPDEFHGVKYSREEVDAGIDAAIAARATQEPKP